MNSTENQARIEYLTERMEAARSAGNATAENTYRAQIVKRQTGTAVARTNYAALLAEWLTWGDRGKVAGLVFCDFVEENRGVSMETVDAWRGWVRFTGGSWLETELRRLVEVQARAAKR